VRPTHPVQAVCWSAYYFARIVLARHTFDETNVNGIFPGCCLITVHHPVTSPTWLTVQSLITPHYVFAPFTTP
jgi:hypothetical protein